MINGIPGNISPISPQAPATGKAGKADFSDTLRKSLEEVQNLQREAQMQAGEVLAGNGGEIHNAMIAIEKADLSFQLMMQVRNKIVQAYQEISRIPI